MMLRLLSNGTRWGSRVLDAETGEDITKRLRPHRIAAKIGGGPDTIIELELCGTCHIDIAGTPRWYIADPKTGDVRELGALVFADGSRVELSAEPFGSVNAGAA